MNKEIKLISEAYRGMLQPNTKLSLTEEKFGTMTQEEFDSIDENQLDELSFKTMSSYVHKGKKWLGNQPVWADSASARNKINKREELVANVNDYLDTVKGGVQRHDDMRDSYNRKKEKIILNSQKKISNQ